MKYHKVGRTDIEVSAVAMGCWAIVDSGTWGSQDEKDAVAAIEASVDAGVTLFDTAEGYGAGASEELLGRTLRSRRHEVVIASKVSGRNMPRHKVVEACERSLRHLGTDYIDIYQLHWPNHNVPFEETAEAIRGLLDQGKVRAAGVSNFGPRDLTDLLPISRPEADQVCYNLLFRAPEYELLPVCIENGVSVLCYSPLAEALLTGKFANPDDVPVGRARTRHFSKDREQVRHDEAGAEQETFEAVGRVRQVAERLGLPMAQVALAWLIRRAGVTSVIAGARSAQQARENAAAAEVELPDDVLAELAGATEPLKLKLGANLDPWQSKSRIR